MDWFILHDSWRTFLKGVFPIFQVGPRVNELQQLQDQFAAIEDDELEPG